MILREFFKRTLLEGGNLEIDGAQAQQIELKVHNRAYMVPILNTLLNAINDGFQQSQGGPLWSEKVLKSRKYLSGSSLHFFNTDIPDAEFERVKPKVGDIDTQVNKEAEPQLAQWLSSVKGQVVGNSKFLGYSRGNEQYSSLWELTDPPIKVQIDFEFVDYTDKEEPTDWAGFSHSSSWDDLSQGIKGVFHKYIIGAFTRLTKTDFLLRKMVGRGKARVEQDVPTTDNMLSFAVSSKEGGGLRAKYEPVLDEKGRPLVIDNLPVMRALPASGYEKDIGTIFQSIFGKRVDRGTLKKLLPQTWSFTGLLQIMNTVLSPEEKEQVFDGLIDKLFAPGAQGLYKGDPERDMSEKNAAVNYALKVLGITPPKNLEQMRQEYLKNYKVTSEGAIGLDRPVAEADEQPKVQAQLRKGMPHLRDLKPADFLDLVDELRADGGRFKLQNIPLNVKIDGFGGRFGKNADGKPFMGTSRTEPRYSAGFVQYHQAKGTTDPEILGRAQKFDQLFDQMMDAIKVIDSKMGADFLVDKQVTCEVLFLPFATQTDEGKLKFVGIEYDQLPKGVDLVLVPYRIVEAGTGQEIQDGDAVVQQIAEVGQSGNVMFMSNRLVQKDGLDVTEIINPLDNLDELKQIVSDTAGKRDRASLELRREVEAKLKPVQLALEKAIDEDPNIVGKDNLGQDYEGIVINSRLGPIKVTSQRQKDIIAQKNASKAAARADAGRSNANKTAVVAIGSFVGHRGHEELFNYTINKAKQVGGDPYLFMGNAVGKDDPIPVDVKLQTWHKMYPKYAGNISGTMAGGTLMQKIKHELINPLPGKPPRYDNIIIMVGEDQAGMNIAQALMKAVNKFQGYENVKVSLEATPRGTGMSFTKLRNVLKDPNATPEQQYAVWKQGFDEAKLGKDWILHLMDITRKGMGITQQPKQVAPQPVAERLSNALIRPRIKESAGVGIITKQNSTVDVNKKTPMKNLKAFKLAELSNEKLGQYKKAASADASAADKSGDYKRGNKRFSGIVKATKKQFANDEKGVSKSDLNERASQLLSAQDRNGVITVVVQAPDGTKRSLADENPRYINQWLMKYDLSLPRSIMSKFVENDLNEFAPVGGDDGDADPYRYPKPTQYSHSVDFFGQFEADHFDHEDFDDATGVFKGYQGRKQIAYFKFDNSKKTGSDDPGMGWYYEPESDSNDNTVSGKPAVDNSKQRKQQELSIINAFLKSGQKAKPGSQIYALMKKHGMAGGLNEFAPGSGGGESGRWYTDDQMTDLVGDGWWEDMDVSGNIPKQQMIQQAQAWLDDQGYSVHVLNCRLNDDDMDWYIEGNFHNPGFAKKGVAENKLGNVLPWPAVANKISSAMKAMGWKAQRKGDDAFMFSTKGAEDESQWYMVMIDNEGDGMFSYALGTFEGGRPDIGEQGKLPTTEASVSEVLMAIRDGYGLAETMLPKSVFAGTKVGQKVGSAGQWKNTGPSKNRAARSGDLVGGSAESIENEEKQRLDPSCWKGYKKQGTKMKGGVRVNNCVPVSEDVENIFAVLIDKIIVNEAIQNNKR